MPARLGHHGISQRLPDSCYRRQSGLTLLEILITLSLLGIIVAAGLPSLSDMISRMSANSAARTLGNSLSLARSEAIKRNRAVTVCATTDGTDCALSQWSEGWIIFIDANNDADGDTGSIDAGDSILQTYQPLANIVLTGNLDLVQYSEQGYGANGVLATFKMCPENNDAEHARSIEISLSGRSRLIESGVACP